MIQDIFTAQACFHQPNGHHMRLTTLIYGLVRATSAIDKYGSVRIMRWLGQRDCLNAPMFNLANKIAFLVICSKY
jgi:hypothetical protein